MQRAAIFVCSKRLLHIFFDGLAEIINGFLIAFGGGFNDAVLQMVLQDDLAGIVNSGAHSCNLYENFAAVPAFFYHPAHGLQMADGAGKAIQHGLGILMGMMMAVVMVLMGMLDAVGMHIFMIVLMHVVFIVHGDSPRYHSNL